MINPTQRELRDACGLAGLTAAVMTGFAAWGAFKSAPIADAFVTAKTVATNPYVLGTGIPSLLAAGVYTASCIRSAGRRLLRRSPSPR